MDKKKIIKTIFFIFFISFAISYIIEETGYYEYNLQNKTVMTSKSMAKFEKDLKEGKDVTMEDYLVNDHKDYTTKLTRSTNKISTKVNKIMKSTIEGILKIISGLVE